MLAWKKERKTVPALDCVVADQYKVREICRFHHAQDASEIITDISNTSHGKLCNSLKLIQCPNRFGNR